MDLHQLLLFVAAGLLLNLTPGPDVLYIVQSGLRQGPRAGVVAACGIAAGCFVHIFAAALGVGALLAASATAFTILKWVGAVYLVWMGLRILLSRAPSALERVAGGTPSAEEASRARSPDRASAPSGLRRPDSARGIFTGAFWTNALNPKVALFFLAFVPQFIAPEVEHKTLAFLTLGLLFNANGLVVNIGWALAAAWVARRVAVVRGAMRWLDRAAAALFIGFGIRLALADNPAR